MDNYNNNMPQYNNNTPQYNNQIPQYTSAAPNIQNTGNQQAANVTPIIRGNADNFRKYGFLTALLGVIYGLLIFENHSGITHPIFMLGALLILKFIRAKDGMSLISDCNGKKGLGIFYVVSLMLLSVHRCLTTSIPLEYLERFAMVLLLLSFMVYLYVDTTGFDISAWLSGICLASLKLIEHIDRIFSDRKAYKGVLKREGKTEKNKNIKAVLIGVAISVPILVVIIPLLASADVVFRNIFSWLEIDIYSSIFFAARMIFMIIAVLVCSYSIITSMASKEAMIKRRGDGSHNPVIAATFTGILGAVYLVFCAIQFLYLFSGNVKLPEGYTYAKYAHEGFYQLLFVCIINIVMVCVCQTFFAGSKILKAMLTVIAVCTYVMIASSAMRMILYIGAYHLTFLRLFVLWFLAVLVFLLTFLIIGMYIKKFPVFKAGMVVITVAFLVFVYSNPEYRIAKYDLAVAANSAKEYDSVREYIREKLSYDVVPAIEDDKELLQIFIDFHVDEYYEDSHLFSGHAKSEKDIIHYKYEDKYKGFRKFNFAYNYASKYMPTNK